MGVDLFYTTVFADAGGEVLFFEDIYRHDETLKRRLAAGYPYAL